LHCPPEILIESSLELLPRRGTPFPACQRQSVRLKSGVAMSNVPMPKTKRKIKSVWMAANPPSFKRIALNP
jgi:hypothetical protein